MDISGNVTWLVVLSKPGCEKKAELNLKRQGYDPYLPLIRTRKMKKKKLIPVVEPLFRRYLFVPTPQQWTSITNTYGVASIIMGDNGPAKMPNSEITRIKSRESSHGFIELAQPEKFKSGQKIRIMDGPFRDSEAIFDGSCGQSRIKALLNLLGGKIKIELPEAAAQAA